MRFSPSMSGGSMSRRRGWAKCPIRLQDGLSPRAPCWPTRCCARRLACLAWNGRKRCRGRRSPPIRIMPSAKCGLAVGVGLSGAHHRRGQGADEKCPAQSKAALDTAVADDPKNAYAVSALGGWHIEVVRGGGATLARMFYGARESTALSLFDPLGEPGPGQCRGALPDRTFPGGVRSEQVSSAHCDGAEGGTFPRHPAPPMKKDPGSCPGIAGAAQPAPGV